MYSRTLRQELELEFSQVKDAEKAGQAARDTLDQLADKGLLDKRKTTLKSKGDVVLFRPYEADLSKSDPSALWKYPPDTPVPLECVQPQNGCIHSHSFSGESAEGKGGPESVFTKPGSGAQTLPIKTVNTSCKPRLEDDPHWPPRPEKRC